ICGAPPRSHCRSLFVYLGILTLPSVFVLSCPLYVKKILGVILYVLLCIIIQHAITIIIIYINKYKYNITQNNFEVFAKNLFNKSQKSTY
ncbi:hypothetical protein C0J52_26522, partial [Blattella germanica]